MTTTQSMTKSRTVDEILRGSAVYREYLSGIDNLRQLVINVEQELVSIEREFYQVDSARDTNEPPNTYDERASMFMLNLNTMLVDAIQRARDSRFDSVHSEMRLNQLIERIRKLSVRVTISVDTRLPESALEEAEDPQIKAAAVQLITKLTEYWEAQKFAIERIQSLTDKYEKTVLSKLQSNCLSFANAFGVKEQKAVDAYTEHVMRFIEKIDQEKQSIRVLCNSFARGVKMQLCRETVRTNMLLRKCDVKTFHILLLMPNLAEKIEALIRVSREWLDREETFLFELHRSIRETKTLAIKTESALVTEKEKQKKIIQTMKNAFLLCRSYRKQLEEVETEMKKLKTEADEFKAVKDAKRLDLDKKVEHVEFLELNLSKTKMNFHMKMRKERLLKQLQNLEGSVSQLETEITRVQNLMNSKSSEKSTFAARVEENERDLSKLRREFSQFTLKVNNMQNDLESLNERLAALQAIETFKTSADVVDNFYDRPASVKLSPSLKRRIAQKKQIAQQPPTKSRSTSDLLASAN